MPKSTDKKDVKTIVLTALGVGVGFGIVAPIVNSLLSKFNITL